jgi:hypothetical protein
MSAVGPLEYRKDILGERFYASRNYNDLSHTYSCPGNNRSGLDWNMTLRQQRKKNLNKDTQTRSAPNLLSTDLQAKKTELGQKEHIDGPYHSTSETVGKYQNYAGTQHMLRNLTRVSSSTTQTIDWQCNLRDGYHGKPEDKWRRFYSRPQQSFDMMAENCSANNQDYQTSHITPQDRRPDRRKGAISIECIRDEPMSFRRNPGCEGTQVGQWEHLIADRRYGHKARRQLGHETTLRSHPDDPNGARIDDTRSDGCVVEMLGKKKWTGHVSYDFMSAQPPEGDHKLYHLSRRRIHAEEDEDNRQLRMNKQARSDANISYKHTGSTRKKGNDDSP